MSDDASKSSSGDTGTMAMSLAAKARMRAREAVRYAYYDDGGKPGVGNCTWGIGILAHRGPCTPTELKASVEPAQVETSFSRKVNNAESSVRKGVTHRSLTQAQFDALVSFIYNVGEGGGKETLKRVDEGHFERAARGISQSVKMRVNTKIGSKLVLARGLIKRRAEESAPFRIPVSSNW